MKKRELKNIIREKENEISTLIEKPDSDEAAMIRRKYKYKMRLEKSIWTGSVDPIKISHEKS